MNQPLPTIHALIRQTTVMEDSNSESDTTATPREKLSRNWINRLASKAEVMILMGRRRFLSLRNDVVVRNIVTKRGNPLTQTVLPPSLRVDVLHQLHDLRVTGHLGIQRTIERVKGHFFWPGLALDVARWCARCEQCARRNETPTHQAVNADF